MRLRILVISSCALLLSISAHAQDIGVSGSALVSLQSVDKTYVGSPYLSEAIGGAAPGAAAAVNVITKKGFVVAVEYSRAWFEREQYGRLVRGGFNLDGIPATTRLADSLLSALVGYQPGRSKRVVILGGISLRLDRPTVDGEERRASNEDGERLPALTGGVDWLFPVSSKVRITIGGRYTYNERDTSLQYLGIGSHIIRAGVGVRVRLN